MRSRAGELVGTEVPVFAFSPYREVVAAVSEAGGLGVLATVRQGSPQEVDDDLTWLERRLNGKPYGVDLVYQAKIESGCQEELEDKIPEGHRQFVARLTEELKIPPVENTPEFQRFGDRYKIDHARTRAMADAVFAHHPVLLANALGPPPADMLERAHEAGMVVAGMSGHARHARKHVEAGVDLVVAQGTEAGGHTGEISTLVLVPQVVDAVAPIPVLAAGGIGTGRQVAAALALGADGVWSGSIWLTVKESGIEESVRQKLLAADSRDFVRTRCLSGKPIRMLRTPWVSAWEAEDAPSPLGSPLQGMLVRDSQVSIWEHDIQSVMGTAAGQVLGGVDAVRTAAEVVAEMAEGAARALDRASGIVGAAEARTV